MFHAFLHISNSTYSLVVVALNIRTDIKSILKIKESGFMRNWDKAEVPMREGVLIMLFNMFL